jgi:hypothetical protein
MKIAAKLIQMQLIVVLILASALLLGCAASHAYTEPDTWGKICFRADRPKNQLSEPSPNPDISRILSTSEMMIEIAAKPELSFDKFIVSFVKSKEFGSCMIITDSVALQTDETEFQESTNKIIVINVDEKIFDTLALAIHDYKQDLYKPMILDGITWSARLTSTIPNQKILIEWPGKIHQTPNANHLSDVISGIFLRTKIQSEHYNKLLHQYGLVLINQ